MTVLQELAALYERRAAEAEWPRPGFSTERIGAVAVLDEDGTLLELRSLMAPTGKGDKLEPRRMKVPTPPADRRGLKVVAGRLWDTMPYALGISGKSGAPSTEDDRARQKSDAFRQAHLNLLAEATHPALIAMRRFCETWNPERFAGLPDGVPLLDQNVVFRLRDGPFLHDLPEAQALLSAEGEGDVVCLVSGRRGPVARLHMPIKVPFHDKNPPLISFNEDAFESHGKKQGDNAPVSEAAAFAYGTALNALLARNSGSNLRIGGDTVAFWASGAGEAEAEDAFAALFSSGGDRDPEAENELASRLSALAEGKPRADEVLDPATRLFVLGLAPNAARLSVRYWLPGTVGDLARRARKFWSECAIEPSPFAKASVPLPPKPWALLYDLAVQRDEKNIPPKLGGELMRAILTGAPYPATILTAVISRLRVEGDPDRNRHGNVDGRRAALIRAVLTRNFQMEVPVSLNEPDGEGSSPGIAYDLGRLFAAFAYAEQSYQKRGASLRSKYMGAASATPARVFPVLMRGYEHNAASLAKAGDRRKGAGVRADRAVTEIMGGLPQGGELPAALRLEDQGRFFIGFYHQWQAFFEKASDASEALIEDGEDEE